MPAIAVLKGERGLEGDVYFHQDSSSGHFCLPSRPLEWRISSNYLLTSLASDPVRIIIRMKGLSPGLHGIHVVSYSDSASHAP